MFVIQKNYSIGNQNADIYSKCMYIYKGERENKYMNSWKKVWKTKRKYVCVCVTEKVYKYI